MQRVDSSALAGLNKVTGFSGAGDPETWFDDGNLQQVLDVGFHLRRARTINQSEGIFTARIANVHAAADSQSTTTDPYNLTGAPQAGFPRPVPEGFDVWLLGMTGTASVDNLISTTVPSTVFLQYAAARTAIGTAGAVSRVIEHYDAQVTVSGGGRILLEGPNGSARERRPRRIPRGATIIWNSTSLLAGTLQLNLILGLFPAGMGQDAE